MKPLRSPALCVARRLLAPLLMMFSLAFAGGAAAQSVSVVITVPVGTTAPSEFSTHLAAWRQTGQVSDVLWLDSTQRDDAGFETFVALEFPTPGYYESWLTEERPKLGAPLVVNRADVLTHGEITPRDSNRSVFKVNTYQPTTGEYPGFALEYLEPLMEGQRDARILVRYTVYQERTESGYGRSWLVNEYRDQLSFNRASQVKPEVRERLERDDPVYLNWHVTKDSHRVAGPETMARYSELPPPELSHLPPYVPQYNVAGAFNIVGSDLKNAVPQLAAGFNQFHPMARMSTSHGPSSEGGIAALYLDASEVAPMGDDAKLTDMMPFHNARGYMPTEISVATGGYEKRGSLFAWAIVVHPDNPLDSISVDELTRIFGSARTGGWERVDNNYKYTSRLARGSETNIRTWGELGLRGRYARQKIDLFSYASPGFQTYFERNWFHWTHKWNENVREYVEFKQTSPDDAGARVQSTVPLEDLRTNRYAMGIAGLMHVKNYPDLKVLAISGKRGEEAIPLTPENVADRSYPLIRDAYFYVDKRPGEALDPRVREFMRFVLSREGQEIIARVGYYYPLTAEYLAEQLAKLDADVSSASCKCPE